MGGEGAMLHMIQTIRENRRLKRSIRRKFKNGEVVSGSYKDWQIYKPDITDEELQKIIAKIRLKTQK